MRIEALDHLVLTVDDVARSVRFYCDVLGMEEITFGEGRKALRFGQQKINLHQRGQEIVPHAEKPTCGSADLCLLTSTPLTEVIAQLQAANVPVLSEIVPRTGAVGAIDSVYLRDPDGNLLELSCYR